MRKVVLNDKIINIIISQIEKDNVELSEKEFRMPKLSLVAKYAPRGNKQYRIWIGRQPDPFYFIWILLKFSSI